MKALGIIGGIGPESTIEYYRAILAAYRERHGDLSAPSIFINSIDLHKLLELVAAGQLEAVTGYLVEELERLANAGATLGILAANTPHVVFDDVVRRSAIPLVSIVEATCEEAKARALQRLGLFGTRFTMQGHFYQDVFSRHGMTIAVPVGDRAQEREAAALAVDRVLPRGERHVAAGAGRSAMPARAGRDRAKTLDYP